MMPASPPFMNVASAPLAAFRLSGCLLLVLAGCSTNESSTSDQAASAPAASRPVQGGLPPRDDLIPVGSRAPDFTAEDHLGRTVSLAELRAAGKVVLVFYPADFTPGCTRQLCDIRDDWSAFTHRDVAVLGVNPAGREKHAEFAARHNFPFPLIVDAGSAIAAAYGAAGTLFTQRTVYVLDSDGTVLLAERGMVPHDRIFAACDRR